MNKPIAVQQFSITNIRAFIKINWTFFCFKPLTIFSSTVLEKTFFIIWVHFVRFKEICFDILESSEIIDSNWDKWFILLKLILWHKIYKTCLSSAFWTLIFNCDGSGVTVNGKTFFMLLTDFRWWFDLVCRIMSLFLLPNVVLQEMHLALAGSWTTGCNHPTNLSSFSQESLNSCFLTF